jgi:hypothetical protein
MQVRRAFNDFVRYLLRRTEMEGVAHPILVPALKGGMEDVRQKKKREKKETTTQNVEEETGGKGKLNETSDSRGQ